MAETNGVAVRRRAHRAGHTDRSAGASNVLDQDSLPERRLHPGGKDARHDVGRPAGREWHDDGDRPRRIIVRPRSGQSGQHRGERYGND
jgi:hypothetical protein